MLYQQSNPEALIFWMPHGLLRGKTARNDGIYFAYGRLLNNRSVIVGLPRNHLFRWCVDCFYLRMMT